MGGGRLPEITMTNDEKKTAYHFLVKRMLILAGVLAICTVILAWIFSIVNDPVRRPDAEIRAEMVAETPPGSSIEEVKAFVEKRFGKVRVIERMTGGKSINVCYGTYATFRQFPWATVVDIIWYFDKDAKLESVHISRWTDTL